jgi:hypothetical protein
VSRRCTREDRRQIFRRHRDCAHVFIDRASDSSNPDQTGTSDLAAGRRRGVVIGRAQGEAGLRGSGGEAPEGSRRPEALADFICRRQLRSERKRDGDGPACQRVQPKAVPRSRSARPHFAPEGLRGSRSVNRGLRLLTIRSVVRLGAAIEPDDRHLHEKYRRLLPVRNSATPNADAEPLRSIPLWPGWERRTIGCTRWRR